MADIQNPYGLPDALPPLRLPPDAELARQARAVPLMRELAALAGWLGENGRPVDADGNLRKDASEEALARLGLTPGRFGVLWKYARAVDWVELSPPDGDAAVPGEDTAAVPGETARTWASGNDGDGEDPDDDALQAWASTFAAVLSEAVCAAAGEGEAPAGIDVHVLGGAVAMVLFLKNRDGLFRKEARDLVKDVMTGGLPRERARRVWDGWTSAHGDPADILLGQLAEAGALTLPAAGDGTIRFTPLALREMRLQIIDEGVDIPLLTTTGELTAEELLALSEGIPASEFEAEADAWLTAHGPGRSAAMLLDKAAASGPARRLTAVSVVTRAGQAAEPAWRDSMDVPALRPYAKVALASLALGIAPGPPAPGGLALLPESLPPDAIPAELRPLPDDLAWLATDMLALACGDEDTSPREIASALAQSVPPGEEAAVLDLLWRGPHPDAERVLSHLGRFHPDKKIAKEARRAAHKAAGRRDPGADPGADFGIYPGADPGAGS